MRVGLGPMSRLQPVARRPLELLAKAHQLRAGQLAQLIAHEVQLEVRKRPFPFGELAPQF